LDVILNLAQRGEHHGRNYNQSATNSRNACYRVAGNWNSGQQSRQPGIEHTDTRHAQKDNRSGYHIERIALKGGET